jgi:hypothetical protein
MLVLHVEKIKPILHHGQWLGSKRCSTDRRFREQKDSNACGKMAFDAKFPSNLI